MGESDGPAISVIIPVYNMAEYVGAAVDSVLDGDFDSLEVIVVDDGSTDGTADVVAPYVTPQCAPYDERVQYVEQSNHGKAAAVNRGFGVAQGSYFTILDADDQLTQSSLSERYRHCEDGEREIVDAVIGGFEVFDSDQTYGKRLPPSDSAEALRRRFYFNWRTPFSLNACLFSGSLVDRVGPMDERFRRCLDGDYAMRLLEAVDRVAIVRSVVYRYRKHRKSRAERLRTRLETARYRAHVSWKNYGGWRKWAAVPLGLTMDAGKFAYELLFGNYKQ